VVGDLDRQHADRAGHLGDVQMLLAYNAIANDGVFVPPQLVRATVDADGQEHALDGGESRQVVSAGTAAAVRTMLTEVVTRGTAQGADVEGFYPAGKTGTAQIPAPDGGYTWPDGTKHYMATFCGFLPADDPQLSVCVVIEHPTAGAYTGGAVAAPAFADFAEFAAAHLHLDPSELVLSAEDLGIGTTALPDAEEGPGYYVTMGEPPPGRVRADVTTGIEPEDDETATAGTDTTAVGGVPPTGVTVETTLSG
jgi:membrane peptidoglycan carboxypeptidase